MGEGSGFGKVILFGEHFVNYGTAGIVSAINLTTQAEVRRTQGEPTVVRDNRRGTPGYIESKREQQQDSISRILQALGLGTAEVEISLGGSLPVYSGIGASAASCVAIIRALSEEFRLGLADRKVNAVAYEGEKAYHGPNHAGLDNTAATYGGTLWFMKGSPPIYEPVRVKRPFGVVIANSGIVANTHEMIDGVARRQSENPVRFGRLVQEACIIGEDERTALEEGDLPRLGQLLNQNHKLLREIRVTHLVQERLVETALKAGAVGAKSTGAGGGGCILALTPDPELRDRVAKAIEQEGFEALGTTIGG